MQIAYRLISRLACCCVAVGCSEQPTNAGRHDAALGDASAVLDTGTDTVGSAPSGTPSNGVTDGLTDAGAPAATSTSPLGVDDDTANAVDAAAVPGASAPDRDGDAGATLDDADVDTPAPTGSSPSDDGLDDADGAAPLTPPTQTTELPSIPGPDDLFVRDAIARIDLTVDAAGVEALQQDPYTYVPGNLELQLADGTQHSLPNVGVRQKGRVGSRRDLDQKSGFLIKTNEYVKGQELLGMKKLALNNLVQDPSSIHEQLAYELFRALDLPASRTSYARVTFNAGPVGLYASVEVIDTDPFLMRWFGDDSGRLYEGEYGADLVPFEVDVFDLDRGDDVAFEDLQELAVALEAMTDPDTFLSDAGELIDIERYVRFAAAELFLSHWDGYAAGRNNYFLYRAPGGLWSWIPWGMDQTFANFEYEVWNHPALLQQKCERSQPCRNKLGEAYEQVVAKVTELDLVSRCDELQALVSAAIEEDTLSEWSLEQALGAIDQVRVFLTERPAQLQEQLTCIDPSTVDLDGDGASGCVDDCADEDPLIFPGASESCNLIDDDCNGLRDDAEMCPTCLETSNVGEPRYAFCFAPLSWPDAAADCIERGGRLVSVHNPEQGAALHSSAEAAIGGAWWIGLNDQAEEGNFVWDDGTGVDFQQWYDGEPNDGGQREDCAQMRDDGLWNDLDCGAPLNYICQLP